MKCWVYIVAFGLTLLTVIGDFLLKLATTKTNPVPYIITVTVMWCGTAVGWYWVMKNMKLLTAGAYFSVMCIVCLACLGIFFFKERVTSLEYFGLFLAVASVVILSRFAS